ncbi:hypothetical protein ABPG72_006410 [Tetrahymena utriculariae]
MSQRQESQKQFNQQYSYNSGTTFDGPSYISQSQVNLDKVKLFERISYSIDQLSDCVLDYLNANVQQANLQAYAKGYSKQDINQIKNLLHATVGNYVVETVKFDDQFNKENQRNSSNQSNHIFSNRFSQSNNEFDEGCSTQIPTSKHTFTSRPLSSINQNHFFTDYQPDEYVLHQEIEKLNDIINQMQQEKEWMQNQIHEMQYEDIISLKQERQTFEEMKAYLADYIFNFKKSFLCVQLNSQKASDIVQSDLFNELYDILTTTENNWKNSQFNKKVSFNYKDDTRLQNLTWKRNQKLLQAGVEVAQLKRRSNSADFSYQTPNIKNEKLSDLNEKIIDQQQKLKETECQKEIEFSIFHTFLRQFTQNNFVENLENKICIENQRELIEKQQEIITQIEQLHQNQEQNEISINQNNQIEIQKQNCKEQNNVFDDNGDSPIFSHLRGCWKQQNVNAQIQFDAQNDQIDCNQERQDFKNDFNCNSNFRKSNEFNSVQIIHGDQMLEQDHKVVFTLHNEEEQQSEQLNITSQNNVRRQNRVKNDLPLQIQSMKFSGNSNEEVNNNNTIQISNNIINIPSNNMNFTIGNDQSDFLHNNIDPSFNQEINNISCINKLEDEPQQIIDFLGTLEQKPTSRFMCQSSFKKQAIRQSLNVNNYKQNQNDLKNYFNESGQQVCDQMKNEFIALDQIQIGNNQENLNQCFQNFNNQNAQNDLNELNARNAFKGFKNNQKKSKKAILMSFNNKEDIVKNCNENQQEDEQNEKSKIESFMNENFDDVNNSLNLEDIEQIEELCEQNLNQPNQVKKVKNLKNIDLPKLDLSTINCTEQIKNMRMTIGQQFMNNQSLAALQISSTKSQQNQFANPQSLFNMISPIHSTQQLNNRQQSFVSKKNPQFLQQQQMIQDQQYNYQQMFGNSQQVNNKMNESILNQTTQNANNNTQLDLLKGLNDTVLNQMEKIEIERSNFYQNYQNLLNEKNDILQREILLKNNIIGLQREIQILSEENSRLKSEVSHEHDYINNQMELINKENENIKTKKDRLRQVKDQLTFRKKQLEDKEKLVGQQQLINMLQEKKIIFQKQTLDQQWSESDKKKAEIEKAEKLINQEWENVKKESKKIQEFISKQKMIKENNQKEIAKELQSIQLQKDEIAAQYRILNSRESSLRDLENNLKEREKKKDKNILEVRNKISNMLVNM